MLQNSDRECSAGIGLSSRSVENGNKICFHIRLALLILEATPLPDKPTKNRLERGVCENGAVTESLGQVLDSDARAHRNQGREDVDGQ